LADTPRIEGLVTRIQELERDVEDRGRIEQALRASEEQYRSLYETALVGLFRTRIEDGKILKANHVGARLMGYASVEALLAADVVISGYYSAERRGELLRELREHGEVSDFEAHWTYPDGREQDISISARIYPEHGYLEGVVIDVTERNQLQARLVQAQKMEAVGTLAGGVAHDFNNLLMGIQGNVSLMLPAVAKDHPHHVRLVQIQELVAAGAELSGQLLGFARSGRTSIRPTDLNVALRRTADMFLRTRRDIRVHRDLTPGLWVADVDRMQLDQVLVNLYVNAGHAMPSGGDLRLSTGNLMLDAAAAARLCVRPGRYVRVSVTDSGVGMDEKTRTRVFEPFFTTRGLGHGTGLGLASAYGILRGHDGAIQVESVLGQGSTFTFFLPAHEGEADHEPPSELEVFAGTETLLLVDDEEVVAEVTRQMLDALGYQVLVARTGPEAIATFSAQPDRIALVLLDMVMPAMDGGDVFDALRSIRPDVRIMLSSGYSFEGVGVRMAARNCDGFLQKPFQLAALSSKLREVLDRK
jgi:two-component system, cell cycle sensor histidine kinase and response regulator CckA